MFTAQKIASGHNNASSAKEFPYLSPPLFADYVRALPQVWRGYAGKKLTGLRKPRTYGKPSVIITFGGLSRAEFAYLKTLTGLTVTLYCLNEDINQWGFYNATFDELTAGDFDKSGDGIYKVVRMTFIDLVAI